MPKINGNTKFLYRPIRNRRRLKNINGQRFGRLVVIGLLGRAKKHTWWLCVCDCGHLSATAISYLTGRETASCGCFGPGHNSTHGMSSSSAYGRWKGIKLRCYSPRHPDYKVYSKRGMCRLWKESFEAFLVDMGHPPSPAYSIERVNNGLGYHCGHCDECAANKWQLNCRWDTAVNQARNRRSSVFLTYRDETKTIAEWAELLGEDYKRFWRRQRLLRDPELIFTPYFK